MLKTTKLSNKPASNRNDNSKSAFSRNNNSKLVFKKNDGNDKVIGFDVSRNGMEHIKKLEKLSKSRKLSKLGILKNKKMLKSQNLAKSGKKLSKSENSTNCDTTKAEPKFLTPNNKIAFNCLWLAFIEAPILWHFDPERHI